MPQTVALFVDVANLFYAARDHGAEVDYAELIASATKDRELLRAYAYTGLDPENEAQKRFHDHLRSLGYRVVAKEVRRFADGGMKANIDIELVVDLLRLAPRLDVAVIASGDGDFAAAIRAVQETGVRVEVTGVRASTSIDLRETADAFLPLAEGNARRGRRAPSAEAPAKETDGARRLRAAARGAKRRAAATTPTETDGTATPTPRRGRRAVSRTPQTGRAARPAPRRTQEPEATPAERPARRPRVSREALPTTLRGIDVDSIEVFRG
jgi:uncharacterized LabA/DUF88 family protein